MIWETVIIMFSIATATYSINRPVYKIVLTQKGFSQFIQYDIDTPPLREFTFCTWIRLYDLDNEQGLFSYVVNGNRIIRLWLDSGGNFMKVAINEKTPSMIPMEISRDVWKHICLSYQSDYGAYALYMDGRLISCASLQGLHGFVLPGGGSIIIGYGTSNAIPSGIEGEVFGANMILSSTIERNHTLKRDPLYEQKRFLQNRVFGNRNLKYIVLGELESKVIKNNFETSKVPPTPKTNKHFLKFSFPFSFTEFTSNFLNTSSTDVVYSTTEKDILDFALTEITSEKIDFWKLVNQVRNEFKNNVHDKKFKEKKAENKTVTLSLKNTLSPPRPKNFGLNSMKLKSPTVRSLYTTNEDNNLKVIAKENNKDGVIPSKTTEGNLNNYNHKPGSKLAGNVLNYLKRINFYIKEPIKLPVNKPLVKISDDFEHMTDFKGVKVHQPLKFQRRNFVSKHLDKREITKTQTIEKINGEKQLHGFNLTTIDVISTIDEHKNQTPMLKEEQRYARNIKKPSPNKVVYEEIENRDFLNVKSIVKNKLNHEESNGNITISPFIKSVENSVNVWDNSSNEIFDTDITNDLFTRSLLQGNKWHNVQTYNNDFTPRRVNMESGVLHKNGDLSEANKKLPSLRLKYKHDFQKFLTGHKDASIIEGRALAKEVSNQSNHDSFSILKYNRGFLPKQRRDQKLSDKINRVSKNTSITKEKNDKKHKPSNLKNQALKEDLKKRRLSEEIKLPEIDKSKIKADRVYGKVSPVHAVKVCTTFQLHDHSLYVQPDGSIDLTRIVSPVKDKNIGIEFIMQNYKRCSLKDSSLEKNSLLFIDWNKTPVRLFGGAFPKKTTDLCGFF